MAEFYGRNIVMNLRELIGLDEEERESIKMPKWGKTFIFFAVWIILFNVFAVIYINNSRYIYFWDNATYWDIAKDIASGAMLPDFFGSLYKSIGNMDYNYTAGLLSAFFIKLFGQTRLVYVITLVDLYLVPSLMITYLLAKKTGKSPYITTALVFLLCPAIEFMAFIGFVDIGGLIGGLLCYYLYFAGEEKKTVWWKYILIGIIVVLMMLWRRWYAFFGVSFITAMLADSIIRGKRWYMVCLTVITVAALLFFCFNDFTFNILLANYGEIYSGYKFSPSIDFKLITRYFGIIYLGALLVSSIIIMVKKRDFRFMFMWVQMTACAIIFMCMQTHGQQHLLLYIPSVIMLTILVIKYINKEWMFLLAIAMAVVNTVNVFIPRSQPASIRDISIYSPIPSFSMLPRKTENTDEILNLKRTLDTVVGENETLGVLASSFEMNEDILRNVEASMGEKQKREDYIESLPQVDSRDMEFMDIYKEINYVLVASPAQTHLEPDSQKVITKAVECFDTWTGIATSYTELYEYAVTIGDMNIRLFKRTGEVPDYLIRSLKAECR